MLKGLTLAVGANNLFNRYPNQINAAIAASIPRTSTIRPWRSIRVLALRHRRRLLLRAQAIDSDARSAGQVLRNWRPAFGVKSE